MKKKVWITLLVVLIAAIVFFVKTYYDNQSIKSFAAVMCSARSFDSASDGAYLEIVFDDNKNTAEKVAVKDEDVIEKISKRDIDEIIGVNIISDIPEKIIKGNHLNIHTDPLQLLIGSEEYDDYFEIADVSFSDKHSFLCEVMEETTKYMIVEPAEDEYERGIAERIKIEYPTDHIDYLYGIGRNVVIYYGGEMQTTEDGMKLIKTEDISTEGFREFELEVKLSDEKIKKQIVKRTPPTDSSGKWWVYGDAALYYYGVENVFVKISGRNITLDKALAEGKITLDAIIAKCNKDVMNGVLEELVYKDGGSQVYKYPDYTIIKYHTLDGNRDVYIGSAEMNISIANK